MTGKGGRAPVLLVFNKKVITHILQPTYRKTPQPTLTGTNKKNWWLLRASFINSLEIINHWSQKNGSTKTHPNETNPGPAIIRCSWHCFTRPQDINSDIQDSINAPLVFFALRAFVRQTTPITEVKLNLHIELAVGFFTLSHTIRSKSKVDHPRKIPGWTTKITTRLVRAFRCTM